MSTLNLDKIFLPKRIAVIGAGRNPSSVGRIVFKNLVSSEYDGGVFPVNPKGEEVEGINAYSSVSEIPEQVDLAIIATPAKTVPKLIEHCGKAGILGVIIISAGFKEVGKEGLKLEENILKNARPYGVRIIGPNCLGVIVPKIKMNATFTPFMPKAGDVALISQSGALCSAILDWSIQENIGFSSFISIGGMIDVDFGDLIDYLGTDGQTHSVLLYIESLTNVRKFMSAARAFARKKPIVVVKSGRFSESFKAAVSHTGALAGEDLVYDAAFQRAGMVRVEEVKDLFNCAEILAKQKRPIGPKLAIITNAGGPGVMAADALIKYGGELAVLSKETIDGLNGFLPSFWSHGNPIDILGDAPPERFGRVLEIILEDKGVDGVLVILTPQTMTDSAEVAHFAGEASKNSMKPLLTSWMGGRSVQGGIEILNQRNIPTYTTPEEAAKTFTYMYSYGRNLELLYETPEEIPIEFEFDRTKVSELVRREKEEVLSEVASKSLLELYGIPIVKSFPAKNGDEAGAIANEIGYPVVLKILSPQVTHKSDAGGVLLGLGSEEAVRRGFEKIMENVRGHKRDVVVEGVTVQKMIDEKGYELIIGSKKDGTFGSVILFGMGGILAEVLQDRAISLPPLNERLAQRLVESIKGYKILQGYRGRPPVNLNLLKEILIRFSYLVVDCPEIEEMDINPLLIGPERAWVLDARVFIDKEAIERALRPYSHLAIRPYPKKYVRQERMKDGTPIILRPIKPEDEPLWLELLEGFSLETMRLRFFNVGQKAIHEMAERYCFIDYEREVAMVAQMHQDRGKKLIGVGRLVTNPDMETAELAVVVGDQWQNRGVGSLLTDYCIQIAKDRGVKRIIGYILSDNKTMLGMFTRRGFTLERKREVIHGILSLE